MCSVLVSALAIVAASFTTPIDAFVYDPAIGSSFEVSSTIGGSGGTTFFGPSISDIAAFSKSPDIPTVVNITISGDKRVDRIAYDIAFPNGSVGHYAFGGQGGRPISLHLHDGEFINEVRIQQGGGKSRRGRLEAYISQGALDTLGEVTVHAFNQLDLPLPGDLPPPGSLPPPGDPLQNPHPPFEPLQVEPGNMGDDAPRLRLSGFDIANGAIFTITTAALIGAPIGLAIKDAIRKNHNSIRIYYIAIITNLGNMIEQGRQGNGQAMVFRPLPNCTRLVGLVGRAGDEVDAVGMVWA